MNSLQWHWKHNRERTLLKLGIITTSTALLILAMYAVARWA